ncbi:MAG: ABC transporter permease, partial [Candidatus Borkfalkia sp.]
DDKVYVNSFLTKLSEGMTVKNNITREYLDYIAAMDPSLYGAIQYGYGMSLNENLYTEVEINPGVLTPDTSDDKGQSKNWSVRAIYDYYSMLLNSDAAAEYSSMASLLSSLGSTFSKMPGTDDLTSDDYGQYVLSQYEVIEGKMPESEDEIVLVIDSKNEVTDLVLAQLGFLSQEEFLGLFTDKEEGEDKTDEEISIDFETVLNKQFTLYYNDTIYPDTDKSATNPTTDNIADVVANYFGFPYTYAYERDSLDASESEGINLNIVGILRPKEDMNYGCLSSGLNCTEALVNKLRANSLKSKIIEWMTTEGKGIATSESGTVYKVPCITNLIKYLAYSLDDWKADPPATRYENEEAWNSAIRAFGGNDTATSIALYAKDFETKDNILNYLDAWNDEQEKLGDEGNVVQYTDQIGLMMSIVQTILDAITYVLVAFTGISLVVSSVMIGVITYVSVVERTKEIGVLRSIGARKRDIKHVFNAETFIIGLCAGLIGVLVSYALCLIVNLITTPHGHCGAGFAALVPGGDHDSGQRRAHPRIGADPCECGGEKRSRHRPPYRIISYVCRRREFLRRLFL